MLIFQFLDIHVCIRLIVLIGFAIFVFVLVVKHGEVRLVAALGDIVVFDGFEYSTSGFMGMSAVGETTLLRELENLLEIARQLFTFHIEGAKTLDAWGVDEPTSDVDGRTIDHIIQWNHLGKRGCVHTRLVGVAYVSSTLVGMGDQAVDECRLAYTAIATEQCDLAFQEWA